MQVMVVCDYLLTTRIGSIENLQISSTQVIILPYPANHARRVQVSDDDDDDDDDDIIGSNEGFMEVTDQMADNQLQIKLFDDEELELIANQDEKNQTNTHPT